MINFDFSRLAAHRLDDLPWTASPSPGVERRRLEREAAESGHTTSVVRYASGSSFPPHVHGGGEEFLVLEGVFSDERGDFPAGTYVRNPIGSSHAPSSSEGCVIFVKLCQMHDSETGQTVVDTKTGAWSTEDGVRELVLYEDQHERVVMQRRGIGETAVAGRELLIIDGDVELDGQRFSGPTWLRIPVEQPADLRFLSECTLWQKTGHLPAR